MSKSNDAPVRPQVNLLPPEIRSRRMLRVVQRWMGISVVVVALVVAGGVYFAGTQVDDAKTELDDAQAETARLQTQLGEYGDVPIVLGRLDDAYAAQIIGMAADVEFEPIMGAFASIAPQAVTYNEIYISPLPPEGSEDSSEVSAGQLSATAQADAEGDGADPATAEELRNAPLFQIVFVGRAEQMPDTAAWLRALSSVPTFSDPYFTSAPITEHLGDVFYQFNASVTVTREALSGRFMVPPGYEPEESAATDGAGGDASADDTTDSTEEG